MAIATVTNIFKLKDGNAFESAKVKKAVEELSREKGVLRQYWVCILILTLMKNVKVQGVSG